jgi:hypothetical protein
MLLLARAAGYRLDPHPNLLKDDLGALCSAPVHTVSLGPAGRGSDRHNQNGAWSSLVTSLV